jgi:putative SOS response-associated peptidase YedK
MCGGYSITKNVKKAAVELGADFDGPFTPRFNARPGQDLPVLLNRTPKSVAAAHWGIIPFWAKEKKSQLINVRLESAEKHVFKKDFAERRCLIFADGFFEWQKLKNGKQPHYFFMKDRGTFTMAGVWEENADGKPCFAILTMPPNALVEKIHDRMPAILPVPKAKEWLSTDTDITGFINKLIPFPARDMSEHAVSREVNVAYNDYPELILPAKRETQISILEKR